MSDFNDKIIAEFRANEGKVGGYFAGAPIVLVPHKGRRTGREFVSPVMYLPDGEGRIYVFGSKAGAPEHPDWYRNLLASGDATVEVGTETYPVRVTEIAGEERDRVREHLVGLFELFPADDPQVTAARRALDRKSTRLNSSHSQQSRMPSSA